MKYAGMPMGMWVLSAARADTITRYLFCRSMTCGLLNCTAHHRSDLVNGSSTDSIPFRDCAADCLPERKGRDAMSLTEIESYRELIQENIGYEYLCQQYETYREDLDEIVELIVETVCAKRKTTRIAGSDFPHEIVRSRFLKLDNSHIEFVMDCLQKNTTEIRNMKQYLLTVLFNAPTTISNHYTSQVNHDLYGGW